MILTDLYVAEKKGKAKFRYDVVKVAGEYEIFERLLINMRGFNVGGLSFNCVQRPARWKQKNASLAITKGSSNITSLTRPDLEINYAYGDIKGTKDGCIVIFNSDYNKVGITKIEVFIARGCRNDTNGLWNLLIDGELDEEMKNLRDKTVTKIVTGQMELSGM